MNIPVWASRGDKYMHRYAKSGENSILQHPSQLSGNK